MRFNFSLRHCAGFLAVALFASTSNANLILTVGTVTETFTTQPAANNWSTPAVLFGASSASISNDLTADQLVGTPANPITPSTNATVTRALLATQLALGATAGTVATANQALYYTDGFVGTTPTGTDANLLMVSLTNGTTGNLTSLSVRYDLGSQNVPTTEEIAGHRVYFSLTGNANTWNPIGDFGTVGSVSFNVPIGTLAAGASAYLLWLDDNAATNPDGLYTIDNVAFTAVPEPSSCLLAFGAIVALGVKGRRAVRKLLGK